MHSAALVIAVLAIAVLATSGAERAPPEALSAVEQRQVKELANSFAAQQGRDVAVRIDLDKAEASYRAWKAFGAGVRH